MLNEDTSTTLAHDWQEDVITGIAPVIHAVEAAQRCEITVEFKQQAHWLVLPYFPLPESWAERQVPVSLVWNGRFSALYLPRNHAATKALVRIKPDLLDPPMELQWGQPEAVIDRLSAPDLWQQGWTCWVAEFPRPTVGKSFGALLQFFLRDLQLGVGYQKPDTPLTDMDQIRHALEQDLTTLPAPPVTREELFHELGKTVHGQGQALRAVSQEAANHLAKTNPSRPAVLLAVGPTGVGKTRTAEALAPAINAMQQDPKHAWRTVRINMSEYKEPHRVSQLLGAPAGYVGYGEKSQLVQALTETPHCVLIFDEIEKAHDDFFEVLMAAMDEGVFTLPQAANTKKSSGKSHQLDCKKAIIVLTSNLGQEAMVAEYHEGLDPLEIDMALRVQLLTTGLKPEIVNRLGRCVIFLPIAQPDRAQIALTAVVETAIEYRLEVKYVCPELLLDVLRRTSAETFGARAERRTISWLLGDAFVKACVDGLQEVRVLSGPTRCEAWEPTAD